MNVVAACPHCAGQITLSPDHSGQTVNCPHCAQQFIGPEISVPVAKVVSANLVSCADCGQSISRNAPVCPHCGAPRQQTPPETPPPLPPPIEQKRTAQEETLYSDEDVSVTTTRVIILGTTYALRNVTSVRMGFTPPNTVWGWGFISLGVILALPALGDLKQGVRVDLPLIMAAAIIGGATLHIRSLKTFHHLIIASSSGEAKALSSYDAAYIARVVASVNEAIVKYR